MGNLGNRESWVDIAKGIAITLVVLFHAVIFLGDIGLAGFWERLSGPLDTFRMPLFFFTAGLFARKALDMQFGKLLSARVAKLVWLYAVWSLIWSIAFQFIPLYRDTNDRENPFLLWLQAFVWPNASTWFIYALGAYFVVAWVLRSLPWQFQLLLAAVLAAVVGSSVVSWENGALEKSCMYFFFYLAAVHLSKWVRSLAPGLRWWIFLLWVAGYGAVLVAVLRLGALAVPGVRLALGCVGVVVGIGISVLLSRTPWSSWVEALGRRTLQVYLVHFYAVLGSVAILAPFRESVRVAQPMWVPLVTIIAIGISLLVHRLTRRVPGLWDLPVPARDKGRMTSA